MAAALVRDRFRYVRHPDISAGRELHLGRGDADDREAVRIVTIKLEASADDAWIGSEPAAPQAIADNQHLVAPFLRFPRLEVAPHFDSHAQRPEEVRRDEYTLQSFGLILFDEVDRKRGLGRNVFKLTALPLKIKDVGD
jgi:hypothetical protein